MKELYSIKKRNPRWKCGSCKKQCKRGDRSMVCEHCLVWSHFNCTGEKKKPEGDWFCGKCVEIFSKDKEIYLKKKEEEEKNIQEQEEESDDEYSAMLKHGDWDMVPLEEIMRYQEFDRRVKKVNDDPYLDRLKMFMKKNGFPGKVILAVDKTHHVCNVHDGNHRLTVAKELGMKWIPVKIMRLSLGLGTYRYVPAIFNEWPSYPCPCDFGFKTKKNKFDKPKR